MDKTAANLLYQIAAKIKSQIKNRTNFLVENVVEKKLLNEPQLNGTFSLYEIESKYK